MVEIPRAKWPKLGVFLHPKVLKQYEKHCKERGARSMTQHTEALIHRELGIEIAGNGKRKAS